MAVLCVWTVAPVSAAAPWRFLVAGDSQGSGCAVNGAILSELAGEAVRHDVDLMILTGDLVSGVRADPNLFEAQLWEWVQIMEPVYEAGIGVYVCRGNHEIKDAWNIELLDLMDPMDNGARRWLSVFGNSAHSTLKLPDNGPPGERYMTYAVEHENALFVSLDLYGGMEHRLVHSLNQAWLDSVLESNRQPHVFVFAHEPAFGTYHEDCLDAYPDRRDAFWRSLERAGARVYFCGHDHYYDHAIVDDGDGYVDNDIHQIISGTAGATFYYWSPPYDGRNGVFTVRQRHHARAHGYMLVTVDDLDVSIAWMQRHDDGLEGTPLYLVRDWWQYDVTLGPAVRRPNGAERVVASRPYALQWRTLPSGATDRVILAYSLDEGATWMPIDVVDNMGSYEWFVPSIESDRCLVRVSDADAPDVWDTSDTVFTVFECQAKLAADLNGDCYVDFADLAILMSEWLMCGNPFDPACGGLD